MNFATATYARRPRTTINFKGLLTRIDTSAWLSGAAMAMGALLIGPAVLLSDPLRLMLVVDAVAVFFVGVLLLQHHMRLSLSATAFGTPRELITSGLFRYTRNPIYVAFLLPLASLAVFSWVVAAITIAFYITAMTLAVIRHEERALSRLFGQKYTVYAAKVPRWLF